MSQFAGYWVQSHGGILESGGLVDFEAEDYDNKTDGSGAAAGASWTELVGNGSSGSGYLRALPDSGLTIDTNIEADSPHLSYDITFTTTGTYYLWLKGWSEDPWSQYVHYGLGGSAISSGYADAPLLSHDGSFTWKSLLFGGSRPTLTIDSEGKHTLDIWMREDGAKIDRILLTTDAGYVPSD